MQTMKCETISAKTYVKRRFPILDWIPKYKPSWLLQDTLAGITVGLTAIPQGIAYGVVAGLGPEYGLYSAFMGCFIYVIFGSCKNITIGPTAIMALIVQPLVMNYGIPGRSEDLIRALTSIFKDYDKMNVYDIILGTSTLIGLVILKNVRGKRTGSTREKIGWTIGLTRNALAVIVGAVAAYIFHVYNMEPFRLTGSMDAGLPPLSLPPFSTNFNNNTYHFLEMTKNMGSTLFTIPIISTIEHIAIAKAFAMGKTLDATQEMLALGMCNIFGSFVRSMPVTGSFTRTAVNYASGVRTTLGGIFTGGLVLLATGFLSNAFKFIPKATLAGIIICAMYYMLDFETYRLLWHAKKMDFFTMMITLLSCVFLGLEIGIGIGVALNLAILLYFVARPSVQISVNQIDGCTSIHVTPEEAVTFPAAENLRVNIMRLTEENLGNAILDCKNLKRIDVTVAKNIKLLSHDLKLRGQQLTFVNCTTEVNSVLNTFAPELSNSFKDSRESNSPADEP
ncbi:sodium-independent sulfate anion transporter-like isoform X4 [Chelonus insularis]|uniref:sodium-independent sulfate anion transporter-like isoform X4 n=1 Tax=Chelonus insularis TaxID=460826 RepID=UPI00158DF531|nr:sodium-independent sulfate anion transporter-like isoform X4 [Chelonus insularis]